MTKYVSLCSFIQILVSLKIACTMPSAKRTPTTLLRVCATTSVRRKFIQFVAQMERHTRTNANLNIKCVLIRNQFHSRKNLAVSDVFFFSCVK